VSRVSTSLPESRAGAADALGRLKVWKGLKHLIKKGNLRRCTRCAGRRDRTKAEDLVGGRYVLRG
jgi:hypothetical protein